jgi:phosphoglycerol transferase MdoB-like AlkP superfamily enzyme
MPRMTPPLAAARQLRWAAAWFAVILMAIKAYYLGALPARAFADVRDYFRSFAAISYVDVLFAAVVWLIARAILALAGGRKLAAQVVTIVFLAFAALSLIYAVANVVLFGVFGGFLTYPLLALVGNVRMLRSSVAANVTPRIVSALVALPLTYIALVLATVRIVPPGRGAWHPRGSIAFASLGVWIIFGHFAFSTEWAAKRDRRIADNPQWVLVSSWWQVMSGNSTVRMADRFPPEDLADFAPLGVRPPSPAVVLRPLATPARNAQPTPPRRPLNVVVIVLESVAARWTGLSGGLYDTTPNLKAESVRGLVFDNFYAHIGRSSNSLGAILLSTYPKLDFRDFTEEFPHPPGTSLATVFRARGYRTAFMMPSYLSWAGWGTFLDRSGFAELRDSTDFPCSPPVSSWGVEDRCLVDAMLQWLERDSDRPFFLVAWAHQMHHPYEPSPGVPLLDLLREPTPDDYDLGRYLNILHETDHQLERFFEAIRREGLENDTVIIVVGDHGQAFGYPHDNYMQGRSVYEEDVHVPMMIYAPRLYRSAADSQVIGSHVDLAPTIAALAGVPAAPDWQGRSLFETGRSPRVYVYVAEDHFTLGVREDNWKYILDLREGIDELYDLDRDPTEQHNLAKFEPERCARFRQRLAAWTDANRRQYERIAH